MNKSTIRKQKALERRIQDFDTHVKNFHQSGVETSYRDIKCICKNLNQPVPNVIEWDYRNFQDSIKEKLNQPVRNFQDSIKESTEPDKGYWDHDLWDHDLWDHDYELSIQQE